jgi:hypothetical protein
MLHHFKPSEDLLSHYARLLCDTVIPFQEDVLNDRIAGVAPSHAIENFERAAALLEGDESMRGTFYGMSFQDSDVGKWIEAGFTLTEEDPEAVVLGFPAKAPWRSCRSTRCSRTGSLTTCRVWWTRCRRNARSAVFRPFSGGAHRQKTALYRCSGEVFYERLSKLRALCLQPAHGSRPC